MKTIILSVGLAAFAAAPSLAAPAASDFCAATPGVCARSFDPAADAVPVIRVQDTRRPLTPYSVAPSGPERPVIRPITLIGVFR